MDRTLILVKPDAFARGLTGEIIARFERKGLTIVAMKHMTVTSGLAEQHYAEHAEKPFFGELVEFITSAPTLAFVLEGDSAIAVVRTTSDRMTAPFPVPPSRGSTSCSSSIPRARRSASTAKPSSPSKFPSSPVRS